MFANKRGGKGSDSAGSRRESEQQRKQEQKQRSQQKKQDKQNKKSGPNTGPIYYLSNKTVAAACKKETERVKKACDEDKEASRQQAKNTRSSNAKLGKLTERVKAQLASVESVVKKGYGYARNDNNAWIEDHCDGLWIKPMASKEGFDKFTDSLGSLKKNIEKELEESLLSAGRKLGEVAKDKVVDYGKKAAAREAAALASLAVPVAGEVIVLGATAWTVVDGIWSAGSIVVDAYGAGKTALAKYQEFKPQLKTLENLLNGNITASTVLAEMMTAAAAANPCIQARRCILVPFEETEAVTGSAGAAQARSGKGCCPGQTGHHVLPGAMFNNENGERCPKPYKHSKALVICTEGAGNRVGSHGRAHIALEKLIEKYKETDGETIKYEAACKRGIEAVREINPTCSEKCLKAQLDAHYKDELKCGKAELVAHSGMGGAKAGKPVEKPERDIKVHNPGAAD